MFGSICWRWLELYPEEFDSMIERFRLGGEPPFLVSDAWPGSLLPIPAHLRVVSEPGENRKKLKPPLYLTESTFRSIGAEVKSTAVVSSIVKPLTRVQTAIDRDSGSAAEGQLYETDCEYLDSPEKSLCVYIRTNQYLDKLAACFRALALTGYGKKCSSGLGEFELVGEPEPCEWLDDAANANAFVALNHFVPAATDPSEGRWRTHVTFPKFHSNGVSNVFKGSILMLTPGSVFRTGEEPPRQWYGSVLPLPRAEMPKAIHYGLCFPAPLVWPGTEA